MGCTVLLKEFWYEEMDDLQDTSERRRQQGSHEPSLTMGVLRYSLSICRELPTPITRLSCAKLLRLLPMLALTRSGLYKCLLLSVGLRLSARLRQKLVLSLPKVFFQPSACACKH